MPETKEHKRRVQHAEHLFGVMSKSIGLKSLPSVSRIAREKRDPYKILVATVLSLRTKDEVTLAASRRLFEFADTAEKLRATHVKKIEKVIYPVGFFKTKARTLKTIAARLIDDYEGNVPDSVDELLKLKGVGRKTAALVVSLGYGKHAICVDTHVHRISNRLGLVSTKTPEQTEFALMELLPKRRWIGLNELLVRYGQQVCKPVSPHCTTCAVRIKCARVGVELHR